MPKYLNLKTQCLSKHVHDSRHEANYCNRLLARKQAGEIHSYQVQVPFEFKVLDVLICTHIVDFLVRVGPEDRFNLDVGLEAHEAKGPTTRTAAWSIKHKLFKVLYPDIKYVIVQKAAWGENKCKATRKINLIIKRSQSKKS